MVFAAPEWRYGLDFSSTLRKKPPVCEALHAAIFSGVPVATISPPPEPPSGPRSMTQSAYLITSRLCSITSTLPPSSIKRSKAASSLAALSFMDREIGVETALKFGVALLAGTVIMYSFWLSLSTIAFWFIRIDNILIIGQYLDQLRELADFFKAPIITGRTATKRREELYDAFRQGKEKLLVVSKVANFAIDLPDANVAIQVSGTFGSRQEEAQRLGRILRPKSDGTIANFYSTVSRDTRDQDFSVKRQLFLTEQGYKYNITMAEEL